MIAFIFIFNIFFCLIFSFPPIWVLCVKMMRMMMECAVGKGPRGRSAGGTGGLSAGGHVAGVQGSQVEGVQGAHVAGGLGGPGSWSTGGPRGRSAGGSGGTGVLRAGCRAQEWCCVWLAVDRA